jgi:hypothetical protein
MSNVKRVQELRRSNAATAIPARKMRRQGSRGSAKRAAIREHS